MCVSVCVTRSRRGGTVWTGGMALEEADGALFAALRQQVSDPKCEAGRPKKCSDPKDIFHPSRRASRTHARQQLPREADAFVTLRANEVEHASKPSLGSLSRASIVQFTGSLLSVERLESGWSGSEQRFRDLRGERQGDQSEFTGTAQAHAES